MITQIFSFYNSATGEFSGRSFLCTDPAALTLNTPEGFTPLMGEYDPLSQRFDLDSQSVVDYIPSAPGPEHEWNAELKRWVLTAEAASRQARHAHALAEIRRLEADEQPRALREAMLGEATAQARLKAINDAIAALRQELRP